MTRATINRAVKAALAAVLFAGAVTVLQHHAVRWWTAHTLGVWPGWSVGLLAAPWSGWGFSACWELWNVWSWSEAVPLRRSWAGAGWLASALVTSALLVAGPAYQLTESTVRQASAPAERQATAGERAQQALVATLAANAGAYRDQGATGNLRRAERALRAETARLLELERAAAPAAPPEPRAYLWGQVGVEALGVLLLQVAVAVAAVRLFGRGRPGAIPWQEYERPARSGAPGQVRARRVAAEGTADGIAPGAAPEATEAPAVQHAAALERADPALEPQAESRPAETESVEVVEESAGGNGGPPPAARSDLGPLAQRAREVREALERRFPGMLDKDLAARFAETLGVGESTLARDLSLLRNHERLVLSGAGRTITERELERVARLAAVEPEGRA